MTVARNPKRKVKEYQPEVSNLKLTVNTEREMRGQWHDDPKYCERHDVYYEGTVEIEGQEMPIEIHLMSCDGSIEGQAGKYNYTGTVNDKRSELPRFNEDREAWRASLDKRPRSCPYCSGNRGVSSKPTHGLTAVAVAEVVVPFLEAEGYELEKEPKPGGWYLFDLESPCKERQDIPAKSRKRFFVAWNNEFDCPVHGNFLWKEEECGL